MANSVSLSSNVVSMGSDSSWYHPSANTPASTTATNGPYLSQLQKPHRIQRLLNIRELVLETRHPPLEVLFHELVFPAVVVSGPAVPLGRRGDLLTQSSPGTAAASAQHRRVSSRSPRPCRQRALGVSLWGWWGWAWRLLFWLWKGGLLACWHGNVTSAMAANRRREGGGPKRMGHTQQQPAPSRAPCLRSP